MRALQLVFASASEARAAVVRAPGTTRSRIAVECFFRARARDVAIFDRGDFDVQVDAIEERAGDALAIALHLHRAATAFAFQVAEVAAGQGFIAATSMNSEGKVTLPAARETVTLPSSSGWRITSRVERLNSGSSSRKRTPCARGSLRRAREWPSRLTSPHPRWCDAASERAAWRRRPAPPFSSPAMLWILVALDRFLERHRRNDRGDAFREHRLPRAGRADHENVVTARDRDFDRALDVPLAFDVRKIDVVVLVAGEEIRSDRRASAAVGFRPG